MLQSKSLKLGKKALLNNLLSFLNSLLRQKKTLVVLEACTPFHLEHFKTIIIELSLRNDLNIAIVTPDEKGMSNLKNVSFYPTIDHFPLYKKADIFISTELNKIPYWFDCPSVYFGHGMGAKLDYVANKGLFEYDYVYSPCRPTYDIQKQTLPTEKVIPIGMPILDDITSRKKEIIKTYNLDEKKPIIVYAPSWCNDITKISDIELILDFLSHKKQFSIIVSPHPSLFDATRCAGKALFSANSNISNIHINTSKSAFTTLDLVKASDIVISDISSILFEAMALRKKVVFDGNKALYEYCQALSVYEQVYSVCPTPNWQDSEDQTIEEINHCDLLSTNRNEFIDNYLFNNGTATNAFIDNIYSIINSR